MSKFYTNIFEIPPKGNLFTAEQNTQLLPLAHKNYYILNIGRVPIQAEVLYGTVVSWHGTAMGPIEIKPGEDKVLDISKNVYFITSVKIYNESSLRTLVHVGKEDGTDWSKKPTTPLNFDITQVSKEIVKFAPGNIPLVCDKLDSIMEFFWNPKGIIWAIVVDVKIQIPPRTKSDLRQLRTKVLNLKTLMDHKEASIGVSLPYQFMQLIEDLVGFEKKFVVSQETVNADSINYIFLPYYSAMVSLKMCLYQFGIINRLKVGLNDEQIRRLLLLSKQLVEDRCDGAVSYVSRICTKAIHNEYNTFDPQLAYDSFATVYTYCGLGGLEFIPYWNGILTNPYWKKKVYGDVVLFSTYFGRPSPMLYKQVVQEIILQPLQPKLIHDHSNKMTRIDIWVWRKNSKALPKIAGMSVFYQNGDTYNLGTVTQEAKSVAFKDAFLVKLTAWGDGAVDCLEFHFSDGRKETCGALQSQKENYREFELDKHFISGVFLANDVPSLLGQASCIAVSFQPII